MKENIEEVIEYLDGIDIKIFLSGMAEQSNYIVGKANEINEAVELLLSDYKRVLKENAELKEYKKIAELTKISCCIAQNCEALNNAIKEGLKNQRLQKENEELKSSNEKLERANKCYINSIHSIVPVLSQDYIEKQKIKDKIEELRNGKDFDEDVYWEERAIDVLQELLESEE